MPKGPKGERRPRDPAQLAKLIVDIAVGEVVESNPDEGKDPAAVALGRRGGLKGGPARAKTISAKRLKYIAKKAASARWSKPRPEN
jgi:hypothetical protein